MILAAVAATAVIAGAIVLTWHLSQNRYGPGPVTIEAATHKPHYLPGETVEFVIYVTNPQEWPVTQPYRVGFYIEKDGVDLAGGDVNIDFGPVVPTFPPHSTTPYNPPLLWNQQTGSGSNRTQVQPGNYTANISIGGYGYDSSDSCIIEIRSAA